MTMVNSGSLSEITPAVTSTKKTSVPPILILEFMGHYLNQNIEFIRKILFLMHRSLYLPHP
ncbi:protein of unknown function [Shewanella benthica]|uniref:Uncharacterized protein n=1 Tax=Shewanella benthica TaxID=43661 RepID=A0A330M226_9GAMM|nr:protein of unknown function [Shewanella benthica]